MNREVSVLAARAFSGMQSILKVGGPPHLFATMLLLVCAAITIPAQAKPASIQSPPSPVAREWTVMIFMNGKNSLEADALNNFHAISSVGSSDRVAIVAELGRPRQHRSVADGDWSGVYRFYVKKGDAPLPGRAVEKVRPGAASDMGRPETLSEFIHWSKAAFPARHYMVIVWNHGQGYRLMVEALSLRMSAGVKAAPGSKPTGTLGGFRAVSSDEDTGSILYNSDVEGSIARNFTTDKLDVLGFDACLMSMIETAYAVTQSTRILVGSEELEPGDGWQYAHWLDKLVANPSMDGQTLGGSVVASYRDQYGGDNGYTTLSMVDVGKIPAAVTELSLLADAIRNAGSNEIAALLAARANLSSYGDWYQPPSRLSVDLLTLLSQYRSKTRSAALQAEADNVAALFRAAVLESYASTRSVGSVGTGLYGSQGIAIYFPATNQDFRADYFHAGYLKTNLDRPIEFVRQERWADLLYVALGIH